MFAAGTAKCLCSQLVLLNVSVIAVAKAVKAVIRVFYLTGQHMLEIYTFEHRLSVYQIRVTQNNFIGISYQKMCSEMFCVIAWCMI